MQASAPSHIDLNDDAAIGAVVRDNPQWKVEISGEGRILFSPLSGTATGPKEVEALLQIATFARSHGGRAYGSQTGFRLPDKSVLGPDASWISSERLASLSRSAKKTAFWHVCPVVVVEVMSEWDSWRALKEKIDRFMRNGAQYAVAVDPDKRRSYERGTPPAGLTLDFEAIFDA